MSDGTIHWPRGAELRVAVQWPRPDGEPRNLSTGTLSIVSGSPAVVRTGASIDVTDAAQGRLVVTIPWHPDIDAAPFVRFSIRHTLSGVRWTLGPIRATVTRNAVMAPMPGTPGATVHAVEAAGGAVAWADVTGKPSTFAPEAHTHALADLTASGAASGQVPQWSGSAWVPAAVPGGLHAWRRLNADAAGANSTADQPWFPADGALTIGVGVYWITGVLFLTSGATSHNIEISIGGTATIEGLMIGRGTKASVGTASTTETTNTEATNPATSRRVTAGNTTTQSQIAAEWLVRVTAAGTIIPRFKYSAAPGSSLVLRGTFIAVEQLSATATTDRVGSWA